MSDLDMPAEVSGWQLCSYSGLYFYNQTAGITILKIYI